MVALGVWQLQRLAWKEDLLARYAPARALCSDVTGRATPHEVELRSTAIRSHLRRGYRAGRASPGRRARQNGLGAIAHCGLAGGGEADVVLGWSRDPGKPSWDGGEVGGVHRPVGGAKLVATPPQAGLAQLAAPDPADMPNNHLAYAVQWFLFALTALVIYVLALRKRWRGGRGNRLSATCTCPRAG